jgi:hypothetical protein
MLRILRLIVLLASLFVRPSFAETPSPETDACKASGLIALKQRTPQVKDVQIDLDSVKILNTDTKIEGRADQDDSDWRGLY